MATTYAGKGNGINGGNHASVTYYDAKTEGSPDASITNLLTGAKWGTALGQSAALQVSFSSANSTYTGGLGGLQNFSAAQIDVARTVMSKWQAVANLTFTEVADSATNAGDIRWANSTSSTATNGYTYYPAASSNSSAGDIYVGTGITNPVVGNRSYLNYLHEFGHSIGLRHPHDSSAAVPTPAGEDQLKYTVMSYLDYAGDSFNGYRTAYFPTTPMLNDVLTIQFLYGANMSYHTGNDVYQWAADKIVYETLWDAGGNDTIDASNQAQSVLLNLNCGEWSQIGVAFSNSQASVRDCLTIAYGATIENATGSEFADTLIGNTVANSLNGGLGDDTLKGGLGHDTLNGGAGNDVLTADAGNDVLNGGTGRDYLNGGIGNDILNGGAGSDTLIGGIGKDVFIFNTVFTANLDKIPDFNPIDDTVKLENAIFTALTLAGTLAVDAFRTLGHDIILPAVINNDYRIVYNQDNGAVFYDADGDGSVAAIQIAILGTNLALTHADFLVI